MPRDRFDDDDDRYDRPSRRRRYDEDDADDDRPARRRSRYDDDEDDDRSDRRRERADEPPANGAATTSLVLGILALIGGLTAIPGLIAGVIGLKKAKQLRGAGHGTALTGTLLSALGLVVLGLTIWGIVWFIGARRETEKRMVANNNLKQIGLAHHNFDSVNGQFNTGVARRPGDAPGRPIPPSELSTRLGWRVDLLPYIEQENLFRVMNPRAAWDDPQNRAAADTPVATYCDPETKADPTTRWRSFYGKGTPFDPDQPSRLGFASILDGTSNTILVIEAGEKVTWTRFDEVKFDPNTPPMPATFGKPKESVFQVLMFDGSVQNKRKTMNPQTLQFAITHAGGEAMFDW